MPLDAGRAQLVKLALRDCAQEQDITYGEIRPTNVLRYKQARWPVVTDCSGWYQCLCYTAGLPDPMGTAYAGALSGGCEGNTASALSHLHPVSLEDVLPGDCVVFGAYPGKHLAVFLQAGKGRTPATLEIGSNGTPSEPARMSLADEQAGFPGIVSTYLRLPAPGEVVSRWLVRNQNGKLLAETKHPVRWAMAHPRSFRRHPKVIFHKEDPTP